MRLRYISTSQKTKQSNNRWRHSPRSKKLCDQKSDGKVLPSVFWDCQGVIWINFLHKGRTITENYYSMLLTTLRAKIKERMRGKLSSGFLFLQNNVPAH